MRKPIVAGQFYLSDRNELLKEIKELIESDVGKKKEGREIFGIISPHAGYSFSGKCAGRAFSYAKESIENADSIIIFGTNHSGIGKEISLSFEDFSTPLGIIKNDKELGKEILSKNLCQDESAHQNEHSIEVQLPFLQAIDPRIKIVPILLKSCDLEKLKNLVSLIFDSCRNLKRKIFVIASGDFTHYGINYGFVPFTSNIKENLYELDKKAISFIEKLDSEGFLNYARKITICGAASISATIELCKLLGSTRARLLSYYTSGDVVGDWRNSVGYASISFE